MIHSNTIFQDAGFKGCHVPQIAGVTRTCTYMIRSSKTLYGKDSLLCVYFSHIDRWITNGQNVKTKKPLKKRLAWVRL